MKDQLQALNERLTAAGFEPVRAVPGKQDGSINVHIRHSKELLERLAADLVAEDLQCDGIRLFQAYPYDLLILDNVRAMPQPEEPKKKAKKNV